MRQSKFKDDLLVLKAVYDLTDSIFKANKMKVLLDILNSDNPNEKYDHNYGQFYKQINTQEMTATQAIENKKQKIKDLQKDIEELQKLKPNEIVQEETYKLISKPAQPAKEEAKELLKDLLKQFESVTLQNQLDE